MLENTYVAPYYVLFGKLLKLHVEYDLRKFIQSIINTLYRFEFVVGIFLQTVFFIGLPSYEVWAVFLFISDKSYVIFIYTEKILPYEERNTNTCRLKPVFITIHSIHMKLSESMNPGVISLTLCLSHADYVYHCAGLRTSFFFIYIPQCATSTYEYRTYVHYANSVGEYPTSLTKTPRLRRVPQNDGNNIVFFRHILHTCLTQYIVCV